MDERPTPMRATTVAPDARNHRGRLFRKYALLFAGVVSASLIANGLIDIWFSYRDQKALLIRIQRDQASAAADKIGQFIKEIEGQLAWSTQLAWTSETIEQRRLEAFRLLRQVPAISELRLVDPAGQEQISISRFSVNVVGSHIDRTKEPAFVEAVANKVYHGPVYFRDASEPYITIALAGAGRDHGVSIAEVNLRFIWDIVSQIKVGRRGQVYLIDQQGRLISHPEIGLVLSRTNISHLTQVKKALESFPTSLASQESFVDLRGQRVLVADSAIRSLGWLVFVELQIAEAHAPIYASTLRSGAVLLGALAFAVLIGLWLARRMVVPIEALQVSADKIGGGDLGQRIAIETGDELEALGNRFNCMAEQLEQSYLTLEGKVQERTYQLEQANVAKSRFLAAASHDLRQPLHALGLFVSQLRRHQDAAEREQVIAQIDVALVAMNELFNALLDISKLDAGVLTPDIKMFPVAQLFDRITNTFAVAAGQKRLKMRAVHCAAWAQSDFILLERILLNLVSNAVRYTAQGGVVIGCRRRGESLRIEVWDSGRGIPEDQQMKVFGEFYRLTEADQPESPGLGLGLAVVDRLCRLLGHPIELRSRPGMGTCFSVVVPSASVEGDAVAEKFISHDFVDKVRGTLVVVIDDDQLVRNGMERLLDSWGCRSVCVASQEQALQILERRSPDVIIFDYQLGAGVNGLESIERLQAAFQTPIPALLISGDTDPERLHEAKAEGYHLLHKPVSPAALRATMNHILRQKRANSMPQHETMAE